ncbi:hypothetical protein GPECTOR_26g499 [Gonium pectorale]|uniref:Fungal lipase-type domain-containing protein n=1 Tax=Gonium pectorale TaxID=33097 RepID=A0A150GFJ8_GONPE|nr:hypothetical protein GPECTOR_26g499 [Gonium pectorale]|eukprot:KXZ48596.1 hypothetical protein GPECTOR_26g499 [Gonium pectorale]
MNSTSCPWWKTNYNCCKLRTCRQWLTCGKAWVPSQPLFAAGVGAWSHTVPSAVNAYIAARLVSGIYNGDDKTLDGLPHPDPAFGVWFCEAMAREGARSCRFAVAGKDSEMAVIDAGASALVVFRGTESGEDTLIDTRLALSWSTQTSRGMPGIPKAFNDFVKEGGVLTTMDSLLAPLSSKPVWFMGHSLGGAYATIAALYWSLKNGLKTFRHELAFRNSTVDPVVGLSYGGLQHVGVRVAVDRYATPCLAASAAGRRHSNSRRHLLGALTDGSSGQSASTTATATDATATTATTATAATGNTKTGKAATSSSSKTAAASSSTTVSDGARYATWDYTKPWLDPSVPYTTAGTSADCGLCHSTHYYSNSLFTCLTVEQRGSVGDF